MNWQENLVAKRFDTEMTRRAGRRTTLTLQRQWKLLINKKLRYREEHSESVVLSWCTLWHFSGENLLMANQPLLLNWPRRLPNAAK